jgi:putative DNA primase/helicase
MMATIIQPTLEDIQRLQQFYLDERATSLQLHAENTQLRELLGDREERIEQLRSENDSNNATINAYRYREERRKVFIRNPDLIPMEKLVYLDALEEMERNRIDTTEPGQMIVEQIAARIGTTPATVGKRLAALDRMGALHYEIGPTEYREGNYYTPVTVAFPLINDPGSIRKDPKDKQGGGREKRCANPACRSENMDSYTVLYCRDCQRAGWYGQVGLRKDANVRDAMKAAGRNDAHIDTELKHEEFHIVHDGFGENGPDVTQNEIILSCKTTIPEHDKMSEEIISTESEDTVCEVQTEQVAPPEALRRLPQFVPWRYEPAEKEGDKPKKVPYQTRGRILKRASTSDPATWSSYEKAIAFIEEAKGWKEPVQFDGIGFVFSKDYTGVDFDHCIVDAVIDELTAARVLGLNTYAEVSPSGTGVHCIAQGTIPAGCKRPDIEMYDSGRFFTFTGQHIINTPPTVEDRQQLLTDLYEEIAPPVPLPLPLDRAAFPHRVYKNGSDAETLEKARTAENGAKFRALFDEGRLSEYRNDHSSADLALCQMLAYWTNGDAEQIDRLFRTSRLMRPKWDKRARAGETYGAGTIRIALLYSGGVSA